MTALAWCGLAIRAVALLAAIWLIAEALAALRHYDVRIDIRPRAVPAVHRV